MDEERSDGISVADVTAARGGRKLRVLQEWKTSAALAEKVPERVLSDEADLCVRGRRPGTVRLQMALQT